MTEEIHFIVCVELTMRKIKQNYHNVDPATSKSINVPLDNKKFVSANLLKKKMRNIEKYKYILAETTALDNN